MDKARRRELRDQYKRSERDARIAHCALTEEQLSDLVDTTDELVVEEGCFHDTRHAEQWAERNGIAPDFFLPGLRELGGYCDCEIVMNCDPGIVFDR